MGPFNFLNLFDSYIFLNSFSLLNLLSYLIYLILFNEIK